MLSGFRFFNSGYCKQLGRLVGRRTWRFERFHAVFVYLEHPLHGAALIDAGYSTRFFEATRRFPQRFYRWLTPTNLGGAKGPAEVLTRHGIDPSSIRTIFVSHFHADHIAGIGDFPNARFVYRADSLANLEDATVRSQVRQGFLAELLPSDFRTRGQQIDAASFVDVIGEMSEFRLLDFWGDGSVVLVDLPGHAVGHYGLILRSSTAEVFYIVDATWDVDVLLAGRTLPALSRGFQVSYPDYCDTQARLRRFAAHSNVPLLACHCPRTQLHVANAES